MEQHGSQADDPQEDKPIPHVRKRNRLTELRNIFLAGIAVLLPAAVTAWLCVTLWGILDEPIREFLKWVGDETKIQAYVDLSETPGLGLVIILALIFLAGFLAKSFIGAQLIRLAELVVRRVPMVRNIYQGIKQLSDALFTSAGQESFRRAVLVKFMGEDAYAVGFVTGETKGEAQMLTPERVMNVFVPTTPNPTSGYLLMVPADKLIPLRMTVEEALKMVISGGIVTPPLPPGMSAPASLQSPPQGKAGGDRAS